MLALLQSIPRIPLDKWVNSAIAWIVGNFGDTFSLLNSVIEGIVSSISFLLTALPSLHSETGVVSRDNQSHSRLLVSHNAI